MKPQPDPKPRHSHGAALEAYLVFASPLPNGDVQNPLPTCHIDVFPENQTHTRALRIYGDVQAADALEVLRGLLLSGQVRWLELGMRGYALMEGKREYRPWRSNKHLTEEALLALARLEPEVRYHAPV
jgi:hypothetical protein